MVDSNQFRIIIQMKSPDLVPPSITYVDGELTKTFPDIEPGATFRANLRIQNPNSEALRFDPNVSFVADPGSNGIEDFAMVGSDLPAGQSDQEFNVTVPASAALGSTISGALVLTFERAA